MPALTRSDLDAALTQQVHGVQHIDHSPSRAVFFETPPAGAAYGWDLVCEAGGLQLPGVGDGIAGRRICSEQAYAGALDHDFDGCSRLERGTGVDGTAHEACQSSGLKWTGYMGPAIWMSRPGPFGVGGTAGVPSLLSDTDNSVSCPLRPGPCAGGRRRRLRPL